MKYCCEEFELKTNDTVGKFEFCEGWNIEGCCGGGCYVVTNIKFCPFCGIELKEEK
ncbi:MAG: hypothetical protein ABIE94_01630 [archaeon]